MAEKRTIDININTNADEASKEFDRFGKAVNTADKSVTDLNKTFEEVYGEIQPLTTRMGEAEDRLYELAAAGDTASAEYQGLLTKVGQYRKVQIQTDLAVDAAATTMGQKLGGALGGATAGFSAVQGVMGLVGGESEQLEKALLKVQSALAIQQGVQGIREAIPAFKQLGASAMKALKGIKTGIAATGIGVLLVAVGAIVAYWDEITEALGVNNESLEEQLELEKQISDEKAKQKSEMEQVIQDNNNHIKRRIDILRLEEDIKDLSIDQEKNADEIFKKQIKILDLKKLQIGVELFSLEGLLSKQEKINKEIQKASIERERQRLIAKKTFDDAKKAEEAAAERADKRLSQLRKIQDLENSILEEGVEKEVEISRVNFERLIADVEGTAKEKKRLTELYLFQQQEAENEIRNRFRQEDLKAEEEFQVESMLPLLESNAQSEIDLKRKTADALILIDDEETQKALDNIEKERLAKLKGIDDGLNYAKQGADAVQQLGDLVFANKMSKLEKGSKEEEELARKQFKFNKALQLGGAIIDAGKAITASLAAAPIAIGPVPNPAGIASLAFAATSSAVNIAKIASTKFESPGGSPDAPTPNIGGGGAPNFNVVGDSGVNQLASLQQQPTQAYVVSGDVTTAQALDRNRVQNATL